MGLVAAYHYERLRATSDSNRCSTGLTVFLRFTHDLSNAASGGVSLCDNRKQSHSEGPGVQGNARPRLVGSENLR